MSRNNRHLSVISRQSEESSDEDHWLNQFQKSLQKGAVQPKVQENLFDQINSIMNGSKSKYTSVDHAVQDMKERSGLTAYLSKVSDEIAGSKKTAAADVQQAFDKKIDLTPIVVKKHPPVMKTLENYIKDTKGNLPVPAIIDKLRSIHQSDCSDAKDWDDDKLIRLVSRMNLGAKTDNSANYENYNNLGLRDVGSNSDIDPANTDAFFGLNPVKL